VVQTPKHRTAGSLERFSKKDDVVPKTDDRSQVSCDPIHNLQPFS
jgi:hypothetical protein